MHTEMLIELYTKNFSLARETKLTTCAVPRIGEFIALPEAWQEWVQNATHAMVHDVEWQLQNNTLLPVVRCHATDHTYLDNRRLRLEELGWLQPRD